MNPFVENFVTSFKLGIETILKIKGNPYSSFEEFISYLSTDLDREYNRHLSCGLSDQDINANLFYYVNNFVKPTKKIEIKEKKYLCPGCLFDNKKEILTGTKFLLCKVCLKKSKEITDNCKSQFYSVFSNHSISGYKCNDCKRFIPNQNKKQIICPYPDCLFVGNSESMHKMHHPHLKEEVPDSEKENSLIIKEDNRSASFKFIKKTIEEQSNSLSYSNFNFTLNHKLFVYQAFLELLEEYPKQMEDYLLYESRSGGFQNKVFQRYISLLEKSLPFVFKKNGKVFRVESLLDSNLSIFDGISNFEAIVEKGVIKNNTQEYYIGGRSAAYTKPYYIGKLLNVVDKKSKISLMDNILDYTFSKIKVKDIEDNTSVIVTHLRVPPHYQMGGMVYVNRIRKSIVDAIRDNNA